MKTNKEILVSIEEFIHEQFPLARQRQIERHTSLIGNGIVDSLGILEIVTHIESEFKLTLTDDEMLSEHFNSIESLAEFVSAKTNAEQPISAKA